LEEPVDHLACAVLIGINDQSTIALAEYLCDCGIGDPGLAGLRITEERVDLTRVEDPVAVRPPAYGWGRWLDSTPAED
jgi:hypothetical protein